MAMKVFIVGVGRSGTSLLQSMLAAHSRCAFLPETGFVRRFVISNKLSRMKDCSWTNIADLLTKDSRVQRLKISLNGMRGFENGGDVGLAVYEHIVKRTIDKETLIIGDKDPRLIESIDKLMFYFPECVVLIVERNSADVLASKKKAEWSAGSHVWTHMLVEKIQRKLCDRAVLACGDKHICRVAYEDLITYPDKVLHKICCDLGIDYESSMLDFQNSARDLVAQDELQWKSNTFGPLLKKNFGKGKSSLPKRELALLQILNTKHSFKKMGTLVPEYSEINLRDKVWVILGFFYVSIGCFIYISAINLKKRF